MGSGGWQRGLGLIACAVLVSSAVTAQPAPPDARTVQLFQLVCAQCHARPGIGVPLIGDAAAWRPRAARGDERLLESTVAGLGGMPPLGSCSFCSERELRDLIALLAGLPTETPAEPAP